MYALFSLKYNQNFNKKSRPRFLHIARAFHRRHDTDYVTLKTLTIPTSFVDPEPYLMLEQAISMAYSVSDDELYAGRKKCQ